MRNLTAQWVELLHHAATVGHVRLFRTGLSCLLFFLTLLGSGLIFPLPVAPVLHAQDITVTELELRADKPIDNLADLESAVVRIEAFGRFVDPTDEPSIKATGRGAGFIIDPSGIAVTNNHVVAGAAFLQVSIAGEAESRNARVLGVSECADLALIDIAGEGYPYLAWSDAPSESGSAIYAAGFPVGANGVISAYNLREGRTSLVDTSIDTAWVSVRGALHHNGPSGPGYAGGPLVNSDAQVIGISYADSQNSNESFALSQSSAQVLLTRLQTGEDIDSIGINGQIVSFLDGSYGVWVASVQAGSLADELGLQGGDIIVSIMDFALTGDWTMATYCNILRSNSAGQPLPVQVIRLATNELLEGQINGRPLIVRSSFADDLAESVITLPEAIASIPNPSNDLGSGQSVLEQTAARQTPTVEDSRTETTLMESNPLAGENQSGTTSQTIQEEALYSDFSPFTDDSGTITLELPNEWSDISNGEWVEGNDTIGVYVSASPNLENHFDAWYSDWDTPGVFFGYSRELSENETPDGWLDSIDLSTDCSYDGRSQLPSGGYFNGYFDVWGSCGNTDSIVLVVAAMPPAKDYIFVIETLSVTRADLLVVDHILDTFRINLQSDDNQEKIGEIVKRQVETRGMIYDYQFVANESGNALLPSTWSDAVVDSWIVDGEEVGPAFAIAPNVNAFQNGWDVPGVWVRTATEPADEIDVDAMLDSLRFTESCTYDARYDHEHNMFNVRYVSRYDLWTDCGDADSILAVVATQSTDPEQFALIEFQAVTDADAEAFGVYLNSFFIGDGPADVADQSEATLADGVNSAEAAEAGVATERSDETTPYINVSDETGTLTLLVPREWTDVSSGEWIVDGESYGLSLSASTDLTAYDEGWETPGAFMGVSRELAELEPEAFLDFFDFEEECTFGEQFQYENEAYIGAYDVWENCGNVSGVYAVLAVKPVGESEPLIMINVLSTVRAEVELFEQILGNFAYDNASLELMAETTNLAEQSDATDVGDIEVVDIDVSAADEPNADSLISRVTVRALNVRSGPGVDNPRIEAVFVGTLLTTIGQVDNCAWLQIVTPDGNVGWVSGSSEYVTMDGSCSSLPEVEPNVVQSAQQSETASATETETRSSQETEVAESESRINRSQEGCFLFQNELNAEVTVTVTRQGVQWNDTFLLQPDEEREQCFDPGDYTYTLDAPPPWGSTNGELEVNSGDRFYFPIRSE